MSTKYQLTLTQVHWIVLALQHHIAEVKQEMDAAPDSAPQQALGELFIEGRERLVTMLTDVLYEKAKTISIQR